MTQPEEKDAPFPETTARVKEGLSTAGIELALTAEHEGLRGSWSHHLVARACPLLSANGKGDSREASEASALGEFVERFASGLFFADYRLPEEDTFLFHPDEVRIHPGNPKKPIRRQKHDRRLLTPELLAFYDPAGELLPEDLLDHNFDDPQRGIIALPFTRFGSGEVAYFPLALLNSLYLSNGMAAGNSRHECISQALGEICERHVKYRVIAEGIALPDLPAEVLAECPQAMAKIAELQQHAVVRVKDASLGGSFPVVAILLLLPDGGAAAFFGCSPRLQVALARTINEIVQGRSVDRLQGFPQPVTEMEMYATAENLAAHFINSVGELPLRLFSTRADLDVDLTPWKFAGDSRAEMHFLLELLARSGHSVWCREVAGFPLDVCQLVVPGLSEVYPVDELLYATRAEMLRLRPQLRQLPKMKAKKLDNFLQRLDRCQTVDSDQVATTLGLAVDQKSTRSRLTFGELKAMAWLARCSRGGLSADKRKTALLNAQQWCRWTAEFAMLPAERRRLYRLLSLLTAITATPEENGCEEALQYWYSRAELDLGCEILAGKKRFYGVDFATEKDETARGLITLWHKYREMVQPQ